MLSDFNEDIENELSSIERRQLDSLSPRSIDLVDLLNDFEFVRLNGVQDSSTKNSDFSMNLVDLTISAHSYANDYFLYAAISDSSQIRVFFGGKDAPTIRTLVKGCIPGSIVSEGTLTNLGNRVKNYSHIGMLSGIPKESTSNQYRTDTDASSIAYLDRIIHGMRTAKWACIVSAYPMKKEHALHERSGLLEKSNLYSSLVHKQLQRSVQSSTAPVKNQSQSISEVLGGEIVNRRAEYLVDLLNLQINRLDKSIASGQWQVAFIFATPHYSTFEQLKALLRGSLTDTESNPDPIRAHICSNSSNIGNEKFHTLLNSIELANFVRLPAEEVPGFSKRDAVSFDSDFRAMPIHDLPLGKIFFRGTVTNEEYRFQSEDLTRHGAVFGVTGSGKTTTLLHILYHLSQLDPPKPFMVIEPAKSEYRALIGSNTASGPNGLISNLRVFTLGNDSVGPFRLNPFEFETDDEQGPEGILTHIDFLKAVFNAAFILYAPMPYVLEIALHEIYSDKGWNLSSGKNVRLSDESWKNRHQYPIFPTLSDLYNKITQVTRRLGYETRIEQDVIAGLKARIGSMRLGSKGLMLDTPRGIPMQRLLSKPTILELENIGNDDEKTFVMGLLLTKIYAFRKKQAELGIASHKLEHLLLIEEAHRLLKNVNTAVDIESSNLRAQAVDAFVNMLSEVRYYGQGVIVAEQIPTKLTPDVIKNTNLKIVHRLLAKDDRDMVAATMNIDEQKSRFLSILQRGNALVYAEGDDHPYHIRLENIKPDHKLSPLSDLRLRQITEAHIDLQPYLLVPDLTIYGIQLKNFKNPDKAVYQAALELILTPEIEITLSKIVFGALYANIILAKHSTELKYRSLVQPSSLSEEQKAELPLVVLVLGLAQAIHQRGAERGWSYELVDQIRHSLTLPLSELIKGTATIELDDFNELYRTNTKVDYNRYPGCIHCNARCLYHLETERLVSNREIDRISNIIKQTSRSSEDKYNKIQKAVQDAVKNWIGANSSSDENSIAYCTSLLIASKLNIDEYDQMDYSNQMAEKFVSVKSQNT